MSALLQVRDLKVVFRQDGRTTHAVKGVSFDVGRGETVALVGESGSGKSVTALSTVQLLGESAQVSGSITYAGKEMLGASEQDLREVRGNDVSFIFQEPMTSLNPLHTLEKQLAESIELHQGLRGEAVRVKIVELLKQVGIRDAESRLGAYPHQLSGGQRQRVMIAMALANGPDLLVADEPTTALDVTIQAQILDLLAELKQRKRLSMLFITHDLTIVRKIAVLAAEAVGRPEPVPVNAPVMAETDQLKIWFPIQRGLLKRTVGYVKAVNSATLSVRAGETIGIVGESGSGKSTLAMAIMRLLSSEGGIIRADMQIVFQDPYGSLSPRMTIEQIIAEGLSIHDVDPGRDQRVLVAEIMEEVGLDPSLMDRYPHEFSGGQRQRIAIARAMILRPKLVVLDEPTSALDQTVQVQIVDLLRRLQQKFGLAYLFISHDLKVVRAVSHKVMVMQNGDVVEAGTTEEIFDAPKTDYTRTLMAAAFEGTVV